MKSIRFGQRKPTDSYRVGNGYTKSLDALCGTQLCKEHCSQLALCVRIDMYCLYSLHIALLRKRRNHFTEKS